MILPVIIAICAAPLLPFAFADLSPRHGTGVLIVAPPRPSTTGILSIPEPAFPFIAPRHDDLRGPCPGLNTLANHGYIPRKGIASFAQIVNASTHAFNMDYDLASGLAALGILSRGNAFTDQLSIGLNSVFVPALPGHIDGPLTRGLAAHGRFEGDVSMTRQDAAIGDNINFQPNLYNELLGFVAQLGDNSTVTGPRSIVNIRTMQEFKFKRFLDSQAADKKLEFHVGRLILSYGEASFTLNFFANGTDGKLSVPTMTSFFRDQKFPENWHRRSSAATIDDIGVDASIVFAAHPVAAGANNASGVYIPDARSVGCSLYNNFVGDNLPGVLVNTTGILKKNVDFLLNTIHNLFPGCPVVLPHGAAGV